MNRLIFNLTAKEKAVKSRFYEVKSTYKLDD